MIESAAALRCYQLVPNIEKKMMITGKGFFFIVLSVGLLLASPTVSRAQPPSDVESSVPESAVPDSAAIPAAGVPEKPAGANVVLIIVDDLGYGETEMMGNTEIPTPHFARLARNGVRCTAGYVTSSYCSPSRAGIFSGQYQSRFGYDRNPTGEKNFHPNAGLPTTTTTFVKQLSQSGYVTALLGKWHLGTGDKAPLNHGFDEFFGFLHEGHFYVPGPPYENVVTMLRDKSLAPGERVVDGSLIRGNYAPISEPAYDKNNPLLRGGEVIVEIDYLTDAITDEAIGFIEQNAEKSFCAVVSYSAVHSPLQAKLEDTKSLQRINDPQRRIFAGMLVALDRGVGRILDCLNQLSLTRQTMVVLISDNGGPTEELTSSNAPLRGGKGSLYEGGIRVPMVWSMPGNLPSGATENRVVVSLDIAATALELAGIDPAKTATAKPPQRLDGHSVLPWIGRTAEPSPHEQVYWRMPGGKMALRQGNWKIVRAGADKPIELYHLASDPSESRDLASDQTVVLRQLINAWRAVDSEMAAPLTLDGT